MVLRHAFRLHLSSRAPLRDRDHFEARRRVSTARAYHLYTGTLYLLGIVSVYWLARIGSGSRGGALLSAAGTALVSPSFLLLPVVRHDSFFEIPQRLHVLMAYGEGPHISALAVMPAALALSFLALRSRNRLALAGAAVLCALTVANNFYGATALAIFFPVLAWSVWVGRPQRSVWFIAAGISALAYALSAFWLTPSYLRVTAMNLSLVAFPGNTWSRLVALLAVLLFCGLTWRWGARKPERVWTIFVAGAGLFLSLYVLGFYYFGFLVAGDPRRLVPELDLALVFVMTGVVRALWVAKPNLRVLVLLVPLAAAHPVLRYMRNAYFPFPKAANIDHQYEFLMSKWIHDHLPGARVLPSGTVRFWFDAWFDNAQEDGGSEQQGTLQPDASRRPLSERRRRTRGHRYLVGTGFGHGRRHRPGQYRPRSLPRLSKAGEVPRARAGALRRSAWDGDLRDSAAVPRNRPRR